MDKPLRAVPADEFDQVVRLARFREAHPDVIVGDGGFGTWQAQVPRQNGETVITSYVLKDLLDKLDALFAALGPSSGWVPRSGRACGGAGGHPPSSPPGTCARPHAFPGRGGHAGTARPPGAGPHSAPGDGRSSLRLALSGSLSGP